MSVPTAAKRPVSEFDRVTLPMPPQDGFTADDLDRIPDLPPHTELIDGSLVLVSPRKRFHMRMLRRLEVQLLMQAPETLEVEREMTAVLGERQRPEPDLTLVRAEAAEDEDGTWVAAEDVLLAVEVVSPESGVRDRERRPELYADDGIPHFWLVDKEEGGPVVYVYELDPVNKQYTNTGVYRERLKVAVPCPLDIDLTRLSFDR
ncbi:Uma2 family endonuclease [Nocardiopsis sp. NPDC050513]|uniref:Uma2 family endonuclease n=1 Tax=Nocardiopsis sp. NPDC050513 TaxID=3364338 RepID=UPI0037A7CB30